MEIQINLVFVVVGSTSIRIVLTPTSSSTITIEINKFNTNSIVSSAATTTTMIIYR